MAEIDYLRTRAVAERVAAASAPGTIVRLRHLEFAQAYEFRIREMMFVAGTAEAAPARCRPMGS